MQRASCVGLVWSEGRCQECLHLIEEARTCVGGFVVECHMVARLVHDSARFLVEDVWKSAPELRVYVAEDLASLVEYWRPHFIKMRDVDDRERAEFLCRTLTWSNN